MNIKEYKQKVSERKTESLIDDYGCIWHNYFEDPCRKWDLMLDIVKDELLKRTGEKRK